MFIRFNIYYVIKQLAIHFKGLKSFRICFLSIVEVLSKPITKLTGKAIITLKLNSKTQSNPQIKEGNKMEIRKYFEINDTEDTWKTAKW